MVERLKDLKPRGRRTITTQWDSMDEAIAKDTLRGYEAIEMYKSQRRREPLKQFRTRMPIQNLKWGG